MHPRRHFYGMASRDVDRRPVSRYLVPSSEYLDEAVWILVSDDALQPQLCYLPPIRAPLSEGARPYCLLDWQGAQAPSGGLVIPSSSLMQLRVDEK